MKILVLEDDLNFQLLIGQRLKIVFNGEVEDRYARSITKAKDILVDFQPVVILTDLTLLDSAPDTTVSLLAPYEIPIVAMTASEEIEISQIAIKAGACVCLFKSYLIEAHKQPTRDLLRITLLNAITRDIEVKRRYSPHIPRKDFEEIKKHFSRQQ